MEYPNSTLPWPHSLITFFFNLSYLTQGDLEKIRPKRPTKFGRNDPGRINPGRNDLGPKRPGTIVTSDLKFMGVGMDEWLSVWTTCHIPLPYRFASCQGWKKSGMYAVWLLPSDRRVGYKSYCRVEPRLPGLIFWFQWFIESMIWISI